ncbi:hypothetical protein GCM10027596_32770 [Nocardioides korecus]
MSEGADPTGLAQRIREVRFAPVRLRTSYEMGGVDDLLDDLADAASTGRPLRPLVDAARFTTVRIREGYDIAGVDGFLERLVADSPVG